MKLKLGPAPITMSMDPNHQEPGSIVTPPGGAPTPPVVPPVVPPGSPLTWSAQVAAMPAEIRDHPAMANLDSAEALAKEHINAAAMIGRKGFVPPKADDLSDTKRFMKELGWPEASTDYSMGDFVVPEHLGWDDQFQGEINEAFHGAGLTKEQYAKAMPAAVAVFERQQVALVEASNADSAEKMAALRTEYGGAFDSKMNAGTRALGAIYGEDADRIMKMVLADGTVLGNDVAFVKGIIEMGETHYVGDGLIDSDGVKLDGVMTPAAALAEIERLKSDKEFRKAYTTRKDIGHAEANKRMDHLFMMAYPEG